jgi:hypothetical protein
MLFTSDSDRSLKRYCNLELVAAGHHQLDHAKGARDVEPTFKLHLQARTYQLAKRLFINSEVVESGAVEGEIVEGEDVVGVEFQLLLRDLFLVDVGERHIHSHGKAGV